MITRVLDLAVLLLLAVAILLPRPDARVKSALALDEEARGRVAELQARLLGEPGDVAAAMELSDLFMDGRRPDWALAALAPVLGRYPSDHRLHGRRALALADHYEVALAYPAALTALALCEAGSSVPCGEAERSRLTLLRDTLVTIKGLDARRDPNTAKERILHALKPTYLPPPRAPAAAGKKPPAPSVPAPAVPVPAP